MSSGARSSRATDTRIETNARQHELQRLPGRRLGDDRKSVRPHQRLVQPRPVVGTGGRRHARGDAKHLGHANHRRGHSLGRPLAAHARGRRQLLERRLFVAQYVASEFNKSSASLSLFYHGGGPLRVGIGVRADATRTPQAFVDPATGQVQSTRLNGQYVDLMADYDVTGQIVANGRLSYTRQAEFRRRAPTSPAGPAAWDCRGR